MNFGPITNLLRTVDSLQHDFHLCYATMSTCLQLPLLELLVHQLPASHPIAHLFSPPATVLQHNSTIRHLKGPDIFYLDTNTLALFLRTNFQHFPHRNSSKQAIAFIRSNHLLLNNFVLYNFLPHVPRPTNALDVHLDLTTNTSTPSALVSFLSALISNPDPTKFSKLSPMSTKYFKNLPSSHPSSLITSSSLPSSKWKAFWKLSIPLNARNTWFRLLHRKITAKQRLYQLMPHQFKPYCPICPSPSPIETIEHFLFDCPSKHIVWATALSTYVNPMFRSPTFNQFNDFVHMQSQIVRSPSSPYPALSTSQVFACILQAIWSSHYRSIFEFTSFNPHHILATIYSDLYKLHSQETITSFL